MRLHRSVLAVLLLVCSGGVSSAQLLDVDRELEDAKALYREAKFAQAIGKLHSVIARLDQLHDLQARKIQLADAHLHLALSYVALSDPEAAKESLKQMLRADRNRRLDPDVYAPKVIELFEVARAEVAKEPAAAPVAAPAAPAPSASPRVASKKGGSKTPLILLGAAAAAAGGYALTKGQDDASSTSPGTTSGASTPSGGITPPASADGNIVFNGSSPAPGGTVSIGGAGSLRVSFTITYGRSGNYFVTVGNLRPADNSDFRECVSGTAQGPFAFVAGQPMTLEINVPVNPTSSCLARLPVTTVEFNASLFEGATFIPNAPTVLQRIFSAGWTFVR